MMMRVGCPSPARCVLPASMIRTHVICLAVPYYAVPWAATIIDHYPSFLTIHGLFFLTHRNVDRFFVTFATAFVDLFRQIDKHWDMLMSCIRDGILPDLEGINHVRVHLQASRWSVYTHIDSKDLSRHSFMRIRNVQRNCLKLAPRPPLKVGPLAYGKTLAVFPLYVVAHLEPCSQRCVLTFSPSLPYL